MNNFFNIFLQTFLAVFQILLIIFVSAALTRKKVFTSDHLKGLSAAVINFFLPCLIFSNITTNFYPSELKLWFLLPLSSVLMIAIGLITGWLVFRKHLPQKKDILALTSLQNAGYFVLALGAVIFKDQYEQFKLYCFLFILGISPVLWSFGRFLIGRDGPKDFKFSMLLTPPFIANVLSIILVLTGLRNLLIDFKPFDMLLNTTAFMGKATVPMALFVLGGTLGLITAKINHYLKDMINVMLIKLAILPILTILALWTLKINSINPLVCLFLVIEAASPPAVSILIQAKHYGGDEQKLGSIMLICYVLSLISVPVWLTIWQVIIV